MNEEIKIDKEYITELLNNEPFKDKIKELEDETDELSSYRKKTINWTSKTIWTNTWYDRYVQYHG